MGDVGFPRIRGPVLGSPYYGLKDSTEAKPKQTLNPKPFLSTL